MIDPAPEFGQRFGVGQIGHAIGGDAVAFPNCDHSQEFGIESHMEIFRGPNDDGTGGDIVLNPARSRFAGIDGGLEEGEIRLAVIGVIGDIRPPEVGWDLGIKDWRDAACTDYAEEPEER